MAVDVGGALQRELLELRCRTADDGREVHHLGEPENAPAPHQRLEIAGPERAAR